MKNPKFYVITTGWKCEDTINRCKESVEKQTYRNFVHVVKTDPSFVQPVKVGQNFGRNGKLRNFHQVVSLITEPNVILCDLDADDYLEPNALEIKAREHEDDNVWLTYGSYKTMSGEDSRFAKPYKDDNFRLGFWKASHFKTFRIELYRKIKLKDFKDNSCFYFMVCADLAMMFPMLEMAGFKHIKYTPEKVYVYNDLSDFNDHKMQRQNQKKVESVIRKKPKYQLINSLT